MATNYAYYYAVLEPDGLCLDVQDTTNYILDPYYVPLSEYRGDLLFKYYWPIPEEVNDFNDFAGSWWQDAEHTIPLE